MRFRFLGKLRWPWRAIVVTPAVRAPLVTLNRYPGQVIGIAFRLPDEPVYSRRVHKQLSIAWARPDVRQYPPGWETMPRRDVLFGARNPVIAARHGNRDDVPTLSEKDAILDAGYRKMPDEWEYGSAVQEANGEVWDHEYFTADPPTVEQVQGWNDEHAIGNTKGSRVVVVRRQIPRVEVVVPVEQSNHTEGSDR